MTHFDRVVKIWPWVPTEPETKKYYAGEDQQHFNRPAEGVVYTDMYATKSCLKTINSKIY
jgi:hypothetical protein